MFECRTPLYQGVRQDQVNSAAKPSAENMNAFPNWKKDKHYGT